MNPGSHKSARMYTKNTQRAGRKLLLTFDAFSTLFHPRVPVAEQYCRVAYSYGVSSEIVTPDKLGQAFKESFKAQSKKFPNYGRNEVLKGKYGGPRQWWGDVIRASFANVMATTSSGEPGDSKTLPDGMVERLLDVFASQEGYSLYEDVIPLFGNLREWKDRLSATHSASGNNEERFTDLIVGVISNSDDRVPAVLRSLGLKVGYVRADRDRSSLDLPGFEEGNGETQIHTRSELDQVPNDVDMIITSYEAGEEKPNKLIFDVAKKQAQNIVSTQNPNSNIARYDLNNDWVYLHVGDDYDKDYVGATNAGWNAVLLIREPNSGYDEPKAPDSRSINMVQTLNGFVPDIKKYIQS